MALISKSRLRLPLPSAALSNYHPCMRSAKQNAIRVIEQLPVDSVAVVCNVTAKVLDAVDVLATYSFVNVFPEGCDSTGLFGEDGEGV
jgi:hypothetical protein